MRQKKIKQATIENLKALGVWDSPMPLPFDKDLKFGIEIGSGKGQFITSMAKDFPDWFFIAVEMEQNVCYRLAQKKEALQLNNLIIIMDDAQNLSEYLKGYEASFIQLNFSDPWPKKRHHKRRLTYPTKLSMYQRFLKDDGQIIFRTDHPDFFIDSFQYFGAANLVIKDCNWDFEKTKYMTEYEEKKRKKGPIYQLVAVKHHE